MCCSFFTPRLCDAAILDSYAHVVDEVLRCRIVCMEESDRDHYLHTALAKCERCLAFWLHHGADLHRGAANHPDWIALEWARASNANLEIMRLLTPSVCPSLRPCVPSVRGWSWTCTCTFPLGFVGEKSAR